jgi:hypothetical protein
MNNNTQIIYLNHSNMVKLDRNYTYTWLINADINETNQFDCNNKTFK